MMPTTDLREFAQKVLDMMEAQRRYFRSKNGSDLDHAKQLEREMERTCKGIVEPPRLPLFEEQP